MSEGKMFQRNISTLCLAVTCCLLKLSAMSLGDDDDDEGDDDDDYDDNDDDCDDNILNDNNFVNTLHFFLPVR